MNGLVGGVRQVRFWVGERLCGTCGPRSAEGRLVLRSCRVAVLHLLLQVPSLFIQPLDRICSNQLVSGETVGAESGSNKPLDRRPLLGVAAVDQRPMQVSVLLRETAHGEGG